MDEVAEQIGVKPALPSLFLRHPSLALRCFFNPCIPAQYRLQGPHPWEKAPEYIATVWKRAKVRSAGVRDPSKKDYSETESGPRVNGNDSMITSPDDDSRRQDGSGHTTSTGFPGFWMMFSAMFFVLCLYAVLKNVDVITSPAAGDL
jgi:hypothetical protein